MRLLCHFEGGASDAGFRHPGPSLVEGDTPFYLSSEVMNPRARKNK